jgi:carbon starvation protein
MHSVWLLIGALAAFAVAYRYYSAFLAAKVAVLSDRRATPSHRLQDGVDYHPISRLVLFGQHFAAIAGPGPLIGPVLAAQWGYLPGFIWIVIGACLAGGVHDFITLWASVREDGQSLNRIAMRNIGRLSGLTTSVATLFIVVCTLASVAIVVVNALSESAWGMFTIVVTIPAALITGLWMYKIRPGKVAEATVVGVILVFAGVFLGRPFAQSEWGHLLLFTKPQISIILPVYTVIVSILPVWLLMCPRDYLSSYMKIGVIMVIAAGIFIANPVLKMPPLTSFIHGNGPVISGAVWPFVCIVIMCGAISGFHSLISSGTTPKMVNKESDIRVIGYGAMIMEGFVALTALIAACVLEPGDYFAINTPQDQPAQQAAYSQMLAGEKAKAGWDLAPVELKALEAGTEEKLVGRTGGAVTLAVGMAKVFTNLPGMRTLMSYWYHFIIMFEALFILTLLETGTRVARFVFQEAVSQFAPGLAGKSGKPNWAMNVLMSVVVCGMWGYLLYTGNLNFLWSMLGIANQLLACIALAIGTTYILNHSPKRVYAWVTFGPFLFVVVTIFTGGSIRVMEWMDKLDQMKASLAAMAPADPGTGKAQGAIFNLRLLAFMASTLLVLSVVIVGDASRKWVGILRTPARRRG